jgi:hypothetical protein
MAKDAGKKTSRPSGMAATPTTPVATPIPAKPIPALVLEGGEVEPVTIDGVPSTSAPTSTERIRVMATQDGYYDDRYTRAGDILDVHPDHFTEKWMQQVHPRTPKHVTSSGEALERDRRERKAASLGGQTVPGPEVDIDNPPGLDPLGAEDQGD